MSGEAIGLLLSLTYAHETPSGGLPGKRIRRTIERSELERRLQDQRDNSFTKRRYEEMLEADKALEALEAKALETPAVVNAVHAAADVIETLSQREAIDTKELAKMARALEAASRARKLSEIIKQARLASIYAAAIAKQIEDQNDEDEVLWLIMSS